MRKYPNRLREKTYRKSWNLCFVSVDGTNYTIQEPHLFDSKWFSHNFNGLGLKYELGVIIEHVHIVWANVPFPCGSFRMLRFFVRLWRDCWLTLEMSSLKVVIKIRDACRGTK